MDNQNEKVLLILQTLNNSEAVNERDRWYAEVFLVDKIQDFQTHKYIDAILSFRPIKVTKWEMLDVSPIDMDDWSDFYNSNVAYINIFELYEKYNLMSYFLDSIAFEMAFSEKYFEYISFEVERPMKDGNISKESMERRINLYNALCSKAISILNGHAKEIERRYRAFHSRKPIPVEGEGFYIKSESIGEVDICKDKTNEMKIASSGTREPYVISPSSHCNDELGTSATITPNGTTIHTIYPPNKKK